MLKKLLSAGLCISGLMTVLFLSGCKSRDVEKGEICLKLGDYPLAVAFFSEEVKRHPDSYEARLGLGKALLQQGCATASDTGAWKSAIIQLEAAATLSPQDNIGPLLSEAYLKRAHMLLSAGDSIAALDVLSRAIECNTRAIEPINLAGIIYFRMGETDRAEALFTKAMRLDSANAAARFNLGMVYWQAGRYDDAHGQWYAALAASPGDKDILYWFALAEKKKRETGR
jgi:tetratricopeptide (TPR) repeat protein